MSCRRLYPLVVVVALGCDGASSPALGEESRAKRAEAKLLPSPKEAKKEISVSPVATPPPSRACDKLGFFNVYRRASSLNSKTEKRLTFKLRIDVHEADCGAPDAYGQEIELTLELEAQAEHCNIVRAQAEHRLFGDLGSGAGSKTWSSAMRPAPGLNLADPALEEVVLTAVESGEAIRLERFNYFYFGKVKAGQELARELWGEGSPVGPAYGYSSAASSFWRYTYEYSPPLSLLREKLSRQELTEYNRWATASELRGDLTRLVERTFSGEKGGRARTKLGKGSPPLSATVDWEWDKSEHISGVEPVVANSPGGVLRFSRKPCADCVGGATGWWLWSAHEKQRTER